ncbi:hypothetical protein Micbo1qcDRAFT_208171 [Microdochium bolleyi]|uniref:Uncharacterized protein n=1 Tax=Microdochium bolleyi TaxID=196109 RepID=A0A136IRW4_9PEZI|nr:hypothetical protein Micbo1qcDRAFT_208171 [Microdochium bolleyi]
MIMDEKPATEIEKKQSPQFSRARLETRKANFQRRLSSMGTSDTQLDAQLDHNVSDNIEQELSSEARLKQPETNETYHDQRMADLEEAYDRVKDAVFRMSVDLMAAERITDDRAHEILELKLAANQLPNTAKPSTTFYSLLEELAEVKEERDALQYELNTRQTAARVLQSERVAMEEDKDSAAHHGEVTELKRLVDFYKKKSERASRQVQELRLQLNAEQAREEA